MNLFYIIADPVAAAAAFERHSCATITKLSLPT